MVRVRFAPSPTGFLHIGGLRTALYNMLFARKEGGVFVLRIEDTDRTRLVEGGVENIIRTLAWAGVEPDEGPYLDAEGSLKERGEHGPYVQSERKDLYAVHAESMLENGSAYRCFCTAERLEEMKRMQQAEGGRTMYDGRCRALSKEEIDAALAAGTPFVVRLAVPRTGETAFTDLIRGEVRFGNAVIDDQVLLKSDGFPTYHLANVVDDHLMGITHVIRGEEWLPSTPKHILLYKALGWQPPRFAHLPLLLNADRSKLSKRQGDVAVEDYRAKGYLPEAMVNFIALLGWNPTADREIYGVEELATLFDLSKVNKAGAVFNLEKLDWMNREYLRSLPVGAIAAMAVPFFVERGILKKEGDSLLTRSGALVSQDFLVRVVSLERERATTLADLPDAAAYFFSDDVGPEEGTDLHWKKSTPEAARERLEGIRAHLAEADASLFGDRKALEDDLLAFVAGRGWTNADALWPMRVALTGRRASPSPFEVAWALGRKDTLARLDAAITRLGG